MYIRKMLQGKMKKYRVMMKFENKITDERIKVIEKIKKIRKNV